MEYPYLSLIAGPNRNITSSFHKELNPIVYDPFTQMTKSITVTGSPTKAMTFNYSADNERVLKTESYGTTKNSNLYIRGNNNYPITEKINLNSVLNDKIYIYGPTGLIAFKDATATYFVIKDHLGNTRLLFRSTGTQYTTYDYSPFGSLMRSSISGDTDYRFTGQEFDSGTALYNFRARLYDDELGIFYAVDPGGQNFSPFSYAGNNPVIYVDKDGRLFWLIPAIVGFVTGYVSHGIIQHDWGWGALGSGLLGAVSSLVGYQTAAWASSLGHNIGLSQGLSTVISSGIGGGTSGAFSNLLQGQNVGRGFLAGSLAGTLGGAFSLGAGNLSTTGQFISRTVSGGFVGGLVSDVMGGSFIGGFGTGALSSSVSFWATELTNYVYKDGGSLAEKTYGLTESEKELLKYGLEEYKKGSVTPELLQKLQELHAKLYPHDNSATGILSRLRDWSVNDLRFDEIHIMTEAGNVNFHYDHFSLVTNPFMHILVDEVIVNRIIGGQGIYTVPR
ncbi:MAG: RHS repeat-associated core domain-containing protein [Ignavibacteriaceae bacterium]|jgi:RHS repeat-associated protein|nr:MAG: hypothetical protein F9K42_10190 [Ignavibacterium sp.]MCZ7610765.1 hypothetical protein [Ignavibacterium sp.]MDT3696457.1 RHS repeat-associated core domain-containing protein [Ignavibacterium sp.]MDX9711796.1 RHS repeat-associated core domain-containing protein [Ignavibacteriaceae bacterium]